MVWQPRGGDDIPGFGPGDFLPLNTYSTRAQQIVDSSSNFMTAAFEVNEFLTQPDSWPNSELTYRALFRGNANGDSLFVELYNTTDDEVVTGSEETITGSSFTNAETGVQTYSPPTTGSAISVYPRLRNDDNATTVELAVAQVEIGVVL
jgi:hypothetical protein